MIFRILYFKMNNRLLQILKYYTYTLKTLFNISSNCSSSRFSPMASPLPHWWFFYAKITKNLIEMIGFCTHSVWKSHKFVRWSMHWWTHRSARGRCMDHAHVYATPSDQFVHPSRHISLYRSVWFSHRLVCKNSTILIRFSIFFVLENNQRGKEDIIREECQEEWLLKRWNEVFGV